MTPYTTQDATTPKKGLINALMGGDAIGGATPAEPGGFAGDRGAQIAPPSAEIPAAGVMPPIADAPPPSGNPAGDFSRLNGYDPSKLADPNKHDFKYDTARVMSQFDPRQGFTPDVLAALNKLDYGTFSGSGDKLSLSGAKNAKDAADFADQDWIRAYHAQNGDTKWNFGGGGAAPQGAPTGGPSFAGSSLSPLLQGDAAGGVQQALGQFPEQSDFLQQLLAKLKGSQ
jgi:hypothetical protein